MLDERLAVVGGRPDGPATVQSRISRVLGHVLLWGQWHTSEPTPLAETTPASIRTYRTRCLNEGAHKSER